MKRCSKLLILALMSAGLSFVACDDPEADEEEEVAEEEVAVEDDEDDEDEPVYEEPEFDEDLFILAAYEVNCVEAEIEDEEEADAIKDEIFARYGYTEETYAEAADEFDDNENVELAVEARMEQCDEETARGFAEEGAGELEEGAEEEAAAEEEDEAEAEAGGQEADAADPTPAARRAAPTPARTGTLTADLDGRDFEDATISMRVRDDFDVSGTMEGDREGRSFVIPFSGEVSEQGRITASGDRRGNTINIDARLSERGAEGTLTGDIHQNSYRIRFQTD